MKTFAAAAALGAIASATLDFGNLPNIDLDQFVESTFTNYIDHFNMLDSRTYEQRFWKSDQYWDGKGPIFLYICGEYRCTVPDTRLYPFMVGSQYNAQFMVLEHRYYGDSQPFDNWELDNMVYLSSEQGLADLAEFLGENNPNNVEVMVVGGSYPGAMSAWFRSRYPHLAAGSWASSAVVQPIVDFQQYDKQSYTSTLKSGEFCPSMIQGSMEFVTAEGTKRDAGDSDNYITKVLKDTSVPDLRTDDWLSYFADIVAGAVQYGGRSALCDMLKPFEGDSDEAVTDALVAYGATTGSDPKDYDRNTVASTVIDPNSSGRPWGYQYCTEYGWFQTMSTEHPMRSPIVDEEYFSQYCSDMFGGLDMSNLPKANQTTIDQGGFNTAGTNIFFANGGEDPWQWATQRENRPALNQVSMISDCNDCGHCAELYTPKESDPQALKDTRVAVDNWIANIITYRPESTPATFLQ